jgi:hypothetical protein
MLLLKSRVKKLDLQLSQKLQQSKRMKDLDNWKYKDKELKQKQRSVM